MYRFRHSTFLPLYTCILYLLVNINIVSRFLVFVPLTSILSKIILSSELRSSLYKGRKIGLPWICQLVVAQAGPLRGREVGQTNIPEGNLYGFAWTNKMCEWLFSPGLGLALCAGLAEECSGVLTTMRAQRAEGLQTEPPLCARQAPGGPSHCPS